MWRRTDPFGHYCCSIASACGGAQHERVNIQVSRRRSARAERKLQLQLFVTPMTGNSQSFSTTKKTVQEKGVSPTLGSACCSPVLTKRARKTSKRSHCFDQTERILLLPFGLPPKVLQFIHAGSGDGALVPTWVPRWLGSST